MMPNLPEYGIVGLGILQAGAEVTTVNPIYTARKFKISITWWPGFCFKLPIKFHMNQNIIDFIM